MPRPLKRVDFRVGKTSGGTLWASEAGFVAQVNAAMKAMTDEIVRIMDGIVDRTPDVMYNALEPTFEKAKTYTPKRTGRLVNSAYLEITDFRTVQRVEMGFARGGDPPYAVMVHELVEVPHAPPTQAKFLERPLYEDLGLIERRLGVGYRQVFGVG